MPEVVQTVSFDEASSDEFATIDIHVKMPASEASIGSVTHKVIVALTRETCAKIAARFAVMKAKANDMEFLTWLDKAGVEIAASEQGEGAQIDIVVHEGQKNRMG